MCPVTHLGKLHCLAVRRALFLRHLIENYAVPVAADRDRTITFVTVEALNLWASFARTFYLSCVLNAKTLSGPKVRLPAPGFQTAAQALDFSVKTFRPRVWQKKQGGPWPRREEPTWHDPT